MRRWLYPALVGLVLACVGYVTTVAYYPWVKMSFATRMVSKAAGYNTLYAAPLATDKARAIVRPSPDLAYSSCPFDLSNGPVLLDAEPVPSPYWSVSVFDDQTNVAFVRNNIDAEGKPIRIAIARAGQPVPDGMTAVRVKGSSGIALLRILVPDTTPAGFAPINAARSKSSCKPLS